MKLPQRAMKWCLLLTFIWHCHLQVLINKSLYLTYIFHLSAVVYRCLLYLHLKLYMRIMRTFSFTEQHGTRRHDEYMN